MVKLDKQLYIRLGEQLRKKREEKGYSLEQVAEAIGLTKKTIQRYETAESRITTDVLKSLCKFLDIDPTEIKSFFIFDFKDENETIVNHVDILKVIEENENIYGNHNDNLNYFSDKPELLNLYQHIYESETLQLLFDSAKDLTPQDLEMVLTIIKGIRKERGID